jgi:Zn finger protein HypA/HybF involved in hydrogenase expression
VFSLSRFTRFTFTNLALRYAAAEGLIPEMEGLVPIGIESANVKCLTCGHEWGAHSGHAGGLLEQFGRLTITCPQCGAQESQPTAEG